MMVKHTPTIRPLLSTNCLSVLDYFVGLVFKGLSGLAGEESTCKLTKCENARREREWKTFFSVMLLFERVRTIICNIPVGLECFK